MNLVVIALKRKDDKKSVGDRKVANLGQLWTVESRTKVYNSDDNPIAKSSTFTVPATFDQTNFMFALPRWIS